MFKLCTIILLIFVIENTNSAFCPDGKVGQHITVCNENGWRCTCKADPTQSWCVDNCSPTLHPNPKCKKRYVLPVFRNITTNSGCCEQWNCPYDDDYVYPCQYDQLKKSGYVVRNCRFLNAVKCWCDGKKLTKCTPLCTVRPDFNPYMCHMELPHNYIPYPARDTAHNCCPKVVCDWDNQG